MVPIERPLSRRTALGFGAKVLLAISLAGCDAQNWYGTDVSCSMPDLYFTLTRASDGQIVKQTDFRGKIVALFFGYTFCPDVCPMTLANLTALTQSLGENAGRLSILFVTVDPERDTLEQLVRYVVNFTERATALRGTDDQLIKLTRRLRVTYKIADHVPGDANYEVSHGKSIYVFDAEGEARLIWPSFETADADIAAATRDIERLIADA